MVKVYDAPNAMDYYFIIAHSCNFELVWGKMCFKSVVELKTSGATCELIQCFPHCNGMNYA